MLVSHFGLDWNIYRMDCYEMLYTHGAQRMIMENVVFSVLDFWDISFYAIMTIIFFVLFFWSSSTLWKHKAKLLDYPFKSPLGFICLCWALSKWVLQTDSYSPPQLDTFWPKDRSLTEHVVLNLQLNKIYFNVSHKRGEERWSQDTN